MCRTKGVTVAEIACRVRVLRATLAQKADAGPWYLGEGVELSGLLWMHPVNASRMISLRTDDGIFNINREDVRIVEVEVGGSVVG